MPVFACWIRPTGTLTSWHHDQGRSEHRHKARDKFDERHIDKHPTGRAIAGAIGGVAGWEMEKVNARIIARMASDVPLVPELVGHLIAAGGKRLRPLLTLAGAGLAGGSPACHWSGHRGRIYPFGHVVA